MMAPSLTCGPKMSAEDSGCGCARDARLAAGLGPWHGAGREEMGRPCDERNRATE
jgi:hypothetical protein